MKRYGCWKSKPTAPPDWARQDILCGYNNKKEDPSCDDCAHSDESKYNDKQFYKKLGNKLRFFKT